MVASPYNVLFYGRQITFTKTINKFKRMKPIADRVIIKPAPADEKTKGGIIIPDTAKEKPQRGEVIAVGPGKTGKDAHSMTVQVGDIVLYGKYSGQEIAFEGVDYLIMREEEILVIL
jgi:chaperonin GroES